jgi:hypothetical protein
MDAILVPTPGVHSIASQHIAARSIVMHDKVRNAVMVQVIQQKAVPPYGSFRFNSRLGQVQGPRRQHACAKTALGCLKGPHGTS